MLEFRKQKESIMKNLFKFYCKNKKRPKEFTRSSSGQEQSKVEQSIDFTGGKAPNLCIKTDFSSRHFKCSKV